MCHVKSLGIVVIVFYPRLDIYDVKEQCNEKMLVSTIQSPSEICDLQPQKHCRLITRLTPHLVTKQVCRKVPKEVCHMALTKPHSIKKPMTMKWCTKDIQRAQEAQR